MMRKTTWIVMMAVGLALVGVSAEAQYYGRGGGGENALRFRIGLFTPDGESDYWDDNAAVFGGEAADLEDISVGGDFRFSLGPRLGLMISGDVYEGESDFAYLDFGDAQDRDIFHTTRLDVSSLTAGLVLNLTPPGSAVIPYLGVGGGFYFWTLTEEGDFINFRDPLGPTIFTAFFEDDGTTLGWYLLAGIEVPVGIRWSLFAEGRWHSVQDDLSGNLAGLGELDLSGRQINAGVSWRF